MTLQMVSLIRPSSRKQHGIENNRSWLSTCSQVIRPWLLKIQHGKPCHRFAKLDVYKFVGGKFCSSKIIGGGGGGGSPPPFLILQKCVLGFYFCIILHCNLNFIFCFQRNVLNSVLWR